MNINELQMSLQQSIANTTTTFDYFTLAKTIQTLNMGQIRSANTFSELPAAATNTGLIVYVKNEEALYSSNGTSWIDFVPNSKTLWVWGINSSGQLGDNTTVNKSSPVSVVGGFTDWCQVAGGDFHNLGVRTNGTSWAWGSNSFGQLGDNSTVNKSSPVSVVGGFTDWSKISSWNHNIGLRSNGTLWAWGGGSGGRLGDNSTTNKSSPVSVAGGFTDWCQVAAARCHSLGIRTNGTLWAWGCGGCGELGNNSTVNRSSPVSVVGGFTDWCQVSGGGYHSLGIRTNGTLWTWGRSNSGQLGDGTTVTKSSPVSVVGGYTDWCQVSASNFHSLALRTNETLWAWGCGGDGRLGDNTTVNKSSPVSVVGGFTDWCQIEAGSGSVLGLRTNGTLWAWGCGGDGRLGDNTTVNKSSPVSVVGGFTDWYQVAAGYRHNLAIRRTNI